MKERPTAKVRELLSAAARGNECATEELFDVVYQELHDLASAYMSRERAGHTLQPTALINEAFLRLTKESSGSDNPNEFQDINHFVATAATVMRRILINHARAKKAKKRSGEMVNVDLQSLAESFDDSAIDLIALDDAMRRLAELDQRQHRIVELRFFGGMTIKQCAEILDMSERAVFYEWAHARAWLRGQIDGVSDG
ncbi:MAG: ECF-type sigma factor [Planctomycetota bacterium]